MDCSLVSVDNVNDLIENEINFNYSLVAHTVNSLYEGNDGLHTLFREDKVIEENFFSHKIDFDPKRVQAPVKLALTQGRDVGLFKRAQWTRDGSSIVTISEDNGIRLFIAPSDLLEFRDNKPHEIYPYSRVYPGNGLVSSVVSSSIYPQFELESYYSCLSLTAQRNEPIKLINLLSGDTVGTYPLVDHREQFLAPNEMVFADDGQTFTCGTMSKVSIFDTSRIGHEPILSFPTIPSRHYKRQGLGDSNRYHRGLVSSLNYQPSSGSQTLLAATYDGNACLYDLKSPFPSNIISEVIKSPVGTGITQTVWSNNERYVYLICRNCSEVPILDLRMGMAVCGFLTGSSIRNSQRIYADYSSKYGLAIGGAETDGYIYHWPDAELGISNTAQKLIKAHSFGSTISSVAFNRLEGVDLMVTASGCRTDSLTDTESSDEDEDECDNYINTKNPAECSLKIWNLK
ncbi:hypothetical protein NADFUDRAFT_51979 [Nadsonia fulvescens var. elongata DSM 6958]|uniref:Protein SWT21 n=1 Tax=Nadsonia fulvescens var. elongata DSM 6958 TaxID=857566 RepID=A0A1E3PIV9_9ASCO|nr:hypothetical protein NADFUDRAFT_51979 [Nadsonia fulvescens var. elongata DSM 6958]